MPATRRRGAALEEAILDAAWLELIERGYGSLAYESIAERSRTGKQVIYRRWPTKRDLLLAVLDHRGIMAPTPVIADTGSLRGDAIALLMGANRLADYVPGLFSTMLGAYFDDTSTTPAQLRALVFDGRATGMERVVARAVERGEIREGTIPDRVIALPFDLFRHELIMTLAAVPEATIIDIVDTLFLPLMAPFLQTVER